MVRESRPVEFDFVSPGVVRQVNDADIVACPVHDKSGWVGNVEGFHIMPFVA